MPKLARLALALFCCTTVPAYSATVLVSDTFENGDPTDYSVNFGDPAVIGPFSSFYTQSLLFYKSSSTSPDIYDQVQYTLDDQANFPGSYSISFDVIVSTLGEGGNFSVILDTPSVRTLNFYPDNQIRIYNPGHADWPQNTVVGTHFPGGTKRIEMTIDVPGNLLELKVNGLVRHSGTWRLDSQPDPVIGSLRFSLSGEGSVANIDNVLVTRTLNANPVPVPAAAWLFGSALAGLGWVRRRPR